MVVFDDDLVYVIVFCVVNVCMLPQPGKNGYADWYEFKSNQTELGQPYIGLPRTHQNFTFIQSVKDIIMLAGKTRVRVWIQLWFLLHLLAGVIRHAVYCTI